MKILWANPRVSAITDLSPVRREVLFDRAERGRPDGVWAAALDGSQERRLASGRGGRWSPDGKRVAFSRPLPTAGPGFVPCAGSALWTVEADGTNERLASAECTVGATWSPDSKRLAYVAAVGLNGEVGSVKLVPAEGGSAASLSVGLDAPRDLSWSRRGDRLAFSEFAPATPPSGHGISAGGPRDFAVERIRIVNVAGGDIGLLPRGRLPVWSPTEDRLAFEHSDYLRVTGYETREGRDSLRTSAEDGRNVRVVRRGCCGFTKWTRDGSRLAYLDVGPTPKPEDSATQVFLSRPDGSGRRQVTHLLSGGNIDGYWFAQDLSRVYVLWEFTNVD
jgi:Tol biopolymer transport system component